MEESISKSLILRLIPNNKSDAITINELCALTGYSPREVKATVSELRTRYPICAKETNGGGYWIAEDEYDVIEFITMIEKHKAGYQNTIDNMRTHLKGRGKNEI